MTAESVITETHISLPLFIKGKVRDTYRLNDYLIIVATDRISAFDVVLPNGIPHKGAVLNQISAFWFKKTVDIMPNHLIETITATDRFDSYLHDNKLTGLPDYLVGSSMVVKKAKRLPIECVVRGYITGSAMTEYRQTGSVCGIKLPEGLRESEELAEPIFTPTTKADTGHDMPLSIQEVAKLIGKRYAEEIREKCITIYMFARDYARTRGIIIADTKMEYGLDEDNKLILIDELLTPDSSRFWDASVYQVGQPQESYDKQPVRDWLTRSGWNKEPPAPVLPSDVVKSTSERYRQAFEKLTGQKLR
jgi:phosphoribosylaminoimidazole-succinocarboxamide synthase